MDRNSNSSTESFDARLAGAQRLHQQARLEEAKAAYGKLLDEQPQHAELLRLMGVLNYQTGDLTAAARLFRRAIEAGSTDGRAMEALGYVLAAGGREEEAIQCLAQVVAAHPEQQSAFFNLGTLLMTQEGRLGEAIKALQRAVSLDPSDHRARGALARALLCNGQAWEALVLLDKVLADRPGDVRALAHKTAALSQLGHTVAIDTLVDLESMIYVDRFEGGEGFGSAAELNDLLVERILSHTPPAAEPAIGGYVETDEILDSDAPEVRALVAFIVSAVRRMVGNLRLDSTHPFMVGRPETWSLSGWGMRMGRGGFRPPHFQADGWISGVYFVRLPTPAGADNVSEQGCIELGRGPDDMFQGSPPPVRRIQPQEGMLIAFPSYFWQGSLPVDSDGEYLCIAFDLVPSEN